MHMGIGLLMRVACVTSHLVADDVEIVLDGQTGKGLQLLSKQDTPTKHTHKGTQATVTAVFTPKIRNIFYAFNSQVSHLAHTDQARRGKQFTLVNGQWDPSPIADKHTTPRKRSSPDQGVSRMGHHKAPPRPQLLLVAAIFQFLR